MLRSNDLEMPVSISQLLKGGYQHGWSSHFNGVLR